MYTVEIIQHFLKEVTKPDVLDKVHFATRAAAQAGIRFITLLRNGTHLWVCNISIDEL
jgi:hypothetical protein